MLFTLSGVLCGQANKEMTVMPWLLAASLIHKQAGVMSGLQNIHSWQSMFLQGCVSGQSLESWSYRPNSMFGSIKNLETSHEENYYLPIHRIHSWNKVAAKQCLKSSLTGRRQEWFYEPRTLKAKASVTLNISKRNIHVHVSWETWYTGSNAKVVADVLTCNVWTRVLPSPPSNSQMHIYPDIKDKGEHFTIKKKYDQRSWKVLESEWRHLCF